MKSAEEQFFNYCTECFDRYKPNGMFDKNSFEFMEALKLVLPDVKTLSSGSGVPGTLTPWASRPVKPDFVIEFKSIIR